MHRPVVQSQTVVLPEPDLPYQEGSAPAALGDTHDAATRDAAAADTAVA